MGAGSRLRSRFQLVLECLETFFASAVMDSIVAIPSGLCRSVNIGAIPMEGTRKLAARLSHLRTKKAKPGIAVPISPR